MSSPRPRGWHDYFWPGTRTARAFMQHLAQHSGHDLDFGRITASAWNTASAATFLHPHGLRLDSQPLVEIYRDILLNR